MQRTLDAFRWGGSLAPLLPASVRTRLARQALPDWLCEDLGKPAGSDISALERGPLPPDRIRGARALNFLAQVLSSRAAEVADLRVCEWPWPAGLALADLPIRRRTLNCLMRHPSARNPAELPHLTFSQLLAIPTMGVQSVLDFSCTLEAVAASTFTDRAAQSSGQSVDAVSDVLLAALSEPWASVVSDADQRFRKLLPRGTGSISERIDTLTGTTEASALELNALADSILPVRHEIERISALSLEAALADYVARTAAVSGANLGALLRRLHLTGEESSITLEQAGAEAGVTRERMRQLQVRFLDRHSHRAVFLPQLDQAVEWLTAQAPTSPAVSAAALVEHGIATSPFRPESVVAAARLLGHHCGISIETIRGAAVVVASNAGSGIRTVLREADRLLAGSGVTSVAEVCAVIRDSAGTTAEEADVRGTLEHHGGFEFLADQWFWHPQRNVDPLRSILRRMLSVTTEMDIATVREGVRRQFRYRESLARRMGRSLIVPPRATLSAYVTAHPEFVFTEQGTVKSIRPLDYRSELGRIEQALVDLIRTSPFNVLDRASILSAAAKRGVNTNSASITLSYSPVIEHLGVDLWTIRGAKVDPSAVEALRATNNARPRERRVIDHGWTANGELWLAARVPSVIESFVIGAPSAVNRIVGGRDFAATTDAGNPCGRLRVYDYGQVTGFVPFLRRAGADDEDILMIRFNLTSATCMLSVMSEEELDDISPAEA